jgi:hypothetical protein
MPEDVSWKEYVDSKIAAGDRLIEVKAEWLEKLIVSKAEAAERALELAKENLSIRLEGMNQFRAQLDKQAATFITRAEHNVVEREIQSLRESRAELAGKADQKTVNTALILSVCSLIIGILALAVRIFLNA